MAISPAPSRSLSRSRLEIRSLGPIKKADLELGDFTILTSRNSIGKTFIATAACRLNQGFDLLTDQLIPTVLTRAITSRLEQTEFNRSRQSLRRAVRLMRDPSALRGIVRSAKSLLSQSSVRNLLGRFFVSGFGVDPEDLTRFGSNHARASLTVESVGRLDVGIERSHAAGQLEISEEFLLRNLSILSQRALQVGQFRWPLSVDSPSGPPAPFRTYLEFLDQMYPRILPSQAIFVPQERAALLSSAAVGLNPRNVFDDPAFLPSHRKSESNLPPLSADFVAACRQEFTQTRVRPSRSWPRAIIDLVGVSAHPGRGGTIEFRQGKNRVDPHLLSSSSAQLSLLVTIAESRRFTNLYIEEPEVGLTALNHLRIARYLWESRKSVFATTHSDRFIMKVAHLWAREPEATRRTLQLYELTDRGAERISVENNGSVPAIDLWRTADEELVSDVMIR